MKFERFPWYLLLGLIAGIGLGLLYTWVISPIRYVDTLPNTLRADFKDQYRSAIAAAFMASGDLARAQSRLALLGDPDAVQALSAQAQRMLAAGESVDAVQSLALLAAAIQQQAAAGSTESLPSSVPLLSPTETTSAVAAGPRQTDTPLPAPLETPTPIQTPTPRATRTPTPTLGAPFVVVSQEAVCDPNLPAGLLQVIVKDAANRQVAGAEIVLAWKDGEERFFTGFKPELGNGYADYVMTPEITYTLRLAEGSVSVPDLSAPPCQASTGEQYWGSLRLIFAQP